MVKLAYAHMLERQKTEKRPEIELTEAWLVAEGF
jgi:hypothetical protein